MLENYISALGLVLQIRVIISIAGGTVLGIFMGAMPGLTATMAIAILIPLTYSMPTLMGFGMLLGAYCGAISGGAISATLLKIPGTPSSVATTFDAYPLAQKGEAQKALGFAIISSFIGGILSVLFLSFLSPPIARFALKFGAAEYFSLAIFGLAIIASVSHGSLIKGIVSGLLGVFISLIGTDPTTGFPRFTYGQPALLSGIPLLPALVGLFAISQALHEIEGFFTIKNKNVATVNKKESLFKILSEIINHWRLLIMSA